ncbi:GRAS family transcription factor [Striga asiatica]|uniref:GRAS family transcription factor n=1 Tax=Striga asiatica TaxID=4170 RepID=A0A5A7QLU4_STRAF|nr:GRAS family transcription factor [Striga asiatica]
MKGMPLPYGFEGKGVLELEQLLVHNKKFVSDFAPQISSDYLFQKNCFLNRNSYSFVEPTSVLDSARIPSRPASSSTLSSSLGGGAASVDTAGVAAVSDADPSPKWQQHDSTTATSGGGGADHDLLPVPPSLDIGAAGGNTEKFAMEDWEGVLSESVAVSPGGEHSLFRWIMGDPEDPSSMGCLSRGLHIGDGGGGSTTPELDFSGGSGFSGSVDQVFVSSGECFLPAVPNFPTNSRSEKGNDSFGWSSNNPLSSNPPTNFKFSQNITQNPSPPFNTNLNPIVFDSSPEIKPPIFNPQLLINHHQAQNTQNPSLFLPLSHPHPRSPNLLGPPQPKRHNPGGPIDGGFQPGGPTPKGPLTDTGQHPEFLMARENLHPHQLQFLPPYLHHGPAVGPVPRPKPDDCHQLQRAVVDQIYKAAELVQTGNPVHAQGILARLNHQLSPIGKPFMRAAFYCKEALQSLLLNNNNNNATSSSSSSPFSLVLKIGAYKSFSEVSPLVQFANFTCNQAILEAVEGFDRIHIVDFDIGLGGQWASLMQELALQNSGPSGPPTLKITAVIASPSARDHLEMGLTCENLIQFASEVNIGFEFDVMGFDSLSSSPFDGEAVVVNLPISCLASCQLSPPPFVLRSVKQLSPRIVVSVERGFERNDLPFANHIIHALQSCSSLLESLDAVNMNIDSLQKIERFLLQPWIEKIVAARFRAPEKTQQWRALFLSNGFSPVVFSNLTESQAECVIKRTPVRGFQVEKRQSSLVLCWQRKELISASAWRC